MFDPDKYLADLPDGCDFDQAFSSLFAWCQRAFARIERLGGYRCGRYDLKKMPETLSYYAEKGCEVKTLAEYAELK